MEGGVDHGGIKYMDIPEDMDFSFLNKNSYDIYGVKVFQHELIAFALPWIFIVGILCDLDMYAMITFPFRCLCYCLCCCRCCSCCSSRSGSSNQSSNNKYNNDGSASLELQTALIPFEPKQSTDPSPADLHKSTCLFAPIDWPIISPEESRLRSELNYQFMNSRRSVRMFDSTRVPSLSIIENCVKTAGTAPSGAHQQPWHFVIVQNGKLKQQIRELVEREEEKNYRSRMSADWLKDTTGMVGNLHSNHPKEIVKAYLTDAPYLIIALKQCYGLPGKDGSSDDTDFDMASALKDAKTGQVASEEDSKQAEIIPSEKDSRIKHWYVTESCGLACGMLVSALHNANLATLPSTPMGADSEIRRLCNRPENEKALLLLPVGYPSLDCTVPYRTMENWRKPLDELYSVI